MDFSKLFRSSKFASLGKRQVIKTTPDLKSKGDWGLKMTLPKNFGHNFITVSEQDHPDKRTRYHAATELVGTVHRWRENFPIPSKSFPLPLKPYRLDRELSDNSESSPEESIHTPSSSSSDSPSDLINQIPKYTDSPKFIGDLSENEYNKKLYLAKQLSPLWKKLCDLHIVSPSDWYKMLNISTQPIAPLRPNGEGASFIHPPTYRSEELMDRINKDLEDAVGDKDISEMGLELRVGNRVKGRMINPVNGGFSVAIAGYVAYLPQGETQGVSQYSGRSSNLEDLYVKEARFDSLGRPEIIVSMKRPESKESRNNAKPKPQSTTSLALDRILGELKKKD